MAISGRGSVELAAEQADLDELAALAQGVEGEAGGLGAVDEIDDAEDGAAGGFQDALADIGCAGVHHLGGAGPEGGLAFFLADIDNDGVAVVEGAQDGDRVEAEAAGADQHDGLVGVHRHELADGGIDGDAGAGVGGGDGGIERAGIDQVARVRGDDMGGVAAILIDAEAAGGEAHVVFLGAAGGAGAAADPGEDDAEIAGFDAGGVGAELEDAADDLVAHGEGEDDAAVL